MNALPAGRDLDAAEEEVEALRETGVLAVLHRVKRTLRNWVVRNENEITP